ncbi:hypothetical protein [Levilactobacillus yonginensis]|uniref:hypothetical protein n=1 Tax=Levilactobacillus yonginensis TaxID=1054041 RepID=UPI000F77379C|nr:hypothetical protein [Levilactobacillus yonginensis]
MEQPDVIGIDVSMGKAVGLSTTKRSIFIISPLPIRLPVLKPCNLTTNPVVYFESTVIYPRPFETFFKNNRLNDVERKV